MAYLAKSIAGFLGACALIVTLSAPGLAVVHASNTQTVNINTQNHLYPGSCNYNDDAFLHILAKVNLLVRSQYPQAQFYTAIGTPRNNHGLVEQDINQWLFTFQDTASSLKLRYKNGYYEEIQRGPRLVGIRPAHLPLSVDFCDALRLLRQHYRGPFTSVSIAFILYPSVTEPNYTFTLPGNQASVSVGTYDGKVTPPGFH